ncbi:PTS glucose transporter subunit IIA [Lysinibacillus sp. NPDC096418]|uniref:PTS sugar transporter subunit IIA n=1 Tax=Lysinibacillus sp. NPDC096418 TaxID=3364138 RepID=UPI00382AE9AB
MLSKFFGKRKLSIYAPVDGEILSLEQVPDPIFSDKMLGEGLAIMPTKGHIHAPINGTVMHVAQTKHAIGLRSKDGTELLIHIGLETVSLKGKGFTVLVKEGDIVSVGQLIVAVDWDFIEANAKSIITPIVITNSAARQIQYEGSKEGIMGETLLMTVYPK